MLTIDDDPVIRMIVSRVLGSKGIETADATNGVEGLAQARELRPDLVLCDLDMPTQDGFDTLIAMRSDPELQSIPFVLITGVATEADERRMLGAGADGILRKPFSFPVLLETVQRFTQNRGPASA